MKLYLSFGYVDESGVSTRMFHLEQPMTTEMLTNLMKALKGLLGF